MAVAGVGGVARAARACRSVYRIVGRMATAGGQCTHTVVPSHVGVQGDDPAHEGAVRGSAQAFRAVLRDREVRDIRRELALEEMDEASDDPMRGG